MRLDEDQRFRFSPSDLNAFLACPHLTTLELAVARDELPKPYRHNPHAELIRRKGDEHEAAYLASLGDERRSRSASRGRSAGTSPPRHRGGDARRRARHLPGDLRRRRLARARRLRRAAAGRRLRGARHEARAARAAGSHAPALLLHRADRAHPGLDARARCTSSPGRRARDLPARTTTSPTTGGCASASSTRSRTARDTYPYPVEHCGLCDFLALCKQQWERRRPPDARRRDLARRRSSGSTAAGITTLEALGDRAAGHARPKHARRRPSTRSATRPSSSSTTRARRAPRRAAAGRGRARLRAAARAEPGRHLARHRGRPLVRAGARARVPLRLGLPRRGRRAALRLHLGARPRRGEGGLRAARRPDRRAPPPLPGHARLPLRALRARPRSSA